MPAVTHEEKLRQLRFGIDSLTQSHIAFQLRLPDGDRHENGVLGEGQDFRQHCLRRLAKTP